MKRIYFVGVIIGVIIALFGLMWFLQGAGLLIVCPMLCFVDCECVTGGSLFWEIIGAITFIIGMIIAGVSVSRGFFKISI
jgi:hypothetical protein